MNKTKVVHCKRSEFDVYIGRPSIWGNPFSHKEGTLAKFKVGTLDEAIAKFKDWFLSQPELVAKARMELKGKTLGCWCKPGKCHGDVIAEIVDEKVSEIILSQTDFNQLLDSIKNPPEPNEYLKLAVKEYRKNSGNN